MASTISLNYRMTKSGIEYFEDDGTLILFAETMVTRRGEIRYVPVFDKNVCQRCSLARLSNGESLPNLKAIEYLALAVANAIE